MLHPYRTTVTLWLGRRLNRRAMIGPTMRHSHLRKESQWCGQLLSRPGDLHTPMDLNTDFRDMLLALNDAEAAFLVVGAYAVAAHGHPRATGDLDIWVRADTTNAPRVFQALQTFGAPTHKIAESDFASQSIVFQIGLPPGRIDILTVVSGLDFESAWHSRLEITMDGVTFSVVGFNDLIVNKRASGRPKDLADLDALGDDLDG